MENIKLTERNVFEKVECDKPRKYIKGTARRYLRLTPRDDLEDNSKYFAHDLDHDLDDKLGGRKSRIKKRKNKKQSKRRKMR